MDKFLHYFFYVLILFVIFRYSIYLINIFKFPLMSKIFLFSLLVGLSLFLFEKKDSTRRSLYLLLLGFVVFYVILTSVNDLSTMEITSNKSLFMPRLTNYALEETIVKEYRSESPSSIMSRYAPGWITNIFSNPKQVFDC